VSPPFYTPLRKFVFAMSSPAALWVSKALSYAILVGSLIMQAPQIYKILRARSAKGITTIGWAIS
jgi:hypothetical protein